MVITLYSFDATWNPHYFFVDHENIVIHAHMHNESILSNTMCDKGILLSLCSISLLVWFGFEIPLIQILCNMVCLSTVFLPTEGTETQQL